VSGHHRWSDLRDNKRFRDQAGVDRHLGLWCGCPLIECCHNEDTDEGDRWRLTADDLGCGIRVHAHSGSPVSGGTQPWEPGDESWREPDTIAGRQV
jgi:hypothetical protein